MNQFFTTLEKLNLAQVKVQVTKENKKEGYQKCACGSEYHDGEYCPYCQPVSEKVIKAKTSKLMTIRKSKGGIGLGVEIQVGGLASQESLAKVATTIFTRINPFKGNQLLEIKAKLGTQGGIEIISQPLTIKEHQSNFHWAFIFEVIKNYGIMSSKTCSMHVHIDRYSPLFCKRLWHAVNYDHKKEFLAFAKEKEVRKGESDFEEGEYEDRNQVSEVACNLMNANTVEIRVFRQPKSEEELKKMLELVERVVKKCLLE